MPIVRARSAGTRVGSAVRSPVVVPVPPSAVRPDRLPKVHRFPRTPRILPAELRLSHGVEPVPLHHRIGQIAPAIHEPQPTPPLYERHGRPHRLEPCLDRQQHHPRALSLRLRALNSSTQFPLVDSMGRPHRNLPPISNAQPPPKGCQTFLRFFSASCHQPASASQRPPACSPWQTPPNQPLARKPLAAHWTPRRLLTAPSSPTAIFRRKDVAAILSPVPQIVESLLAPGAVCQSLRRQSVWRRPHGPGLPSTKNRSPRCEHAEHTAATRGQCPDRRYSTTDRRLLAGWMGMRSE